MDILDFNHCNLHPACDCGWNVQIGGVREEELAELKKFLKERVIADLTDYSKKIHTEKFLNN